MLCLQVSAQITWAMEGPVATLTGQREGSEVQGVIGRVQVAIMKDMQQCMINGHVTSVGCFLELPALAIDNVILETTHRREGSCAVSADRLPLQRISGSDPILDDYLVLPQMAHQVPEISEPDLADLTLQTQGGLGGIGA